MKKIIISLTLLLFIFSCSGQKETVKKERVTLTISAAASLKKSMDKIVETNLFEKEGVQLYKVRRDACYKNRRVNVFF